MVAAGHDPMSLKRGIDKAVAAHRRRAEGALQADQGAEGDRPGRHHLGQQRPDHRRDHRRGDEQGRQGRRDHGRGGEEPRDARSRSSRACSSTAATCSPYFVTDPERMEGVLEDAYLLIHEKKISVDEGPAAGARADRRAPASRFSSSPRTSRARRWPRWWSTRSAARCSASAVKAPGFGDRRKAMLEDIAILTGGQRHRRGARHQARERHAQRSRPRQAHRRSTRTTPPSSTAPARRPTSRAASSRSARRSRRPPRTTTARSCRSGWRSWSAASRSSRSARRPRSR